VSQQDMTIAVVSDTHGLVRPQLVRALRGVDHILHAGDVGDEDVIETLRALAPVTAVRGNTDTGAWALHLPETTEVRLGTKRVYLIHDLHRLRFDPQEDGLDVVVHGHTHQARVDWRGKLLVLNPGSVGPRRFDRPTTWARLRLGRARPVVEIVELR
jgi:putative phosphoesterase